MTLPPLPVPQGDGYDWMERLSHGWRAVPNWASEGWDLGRWPYVIICHYDGKTYGVALYVESDIETKEFPTEEERDEETDKLAIWYWKHYEVFGAPRLLTDNRLGPYRPS